MCRIRSTITQAENQGMIPYFLKNGGTCPESKIAPPPTQIFNGAKKHRRINVCQPFACWFRTIRCILTKRGK